MQKIPFIMSAMLMILSKSQAVAAPRGQPEDTTAGELWQAWGSDLADFIVGKDSPADGFQALPLLGVLSATNDPPGNYSRITQWCDPIPMMSPMYARSGILLSAVYGNYLQSLRYPQVSKDKVKEIDQLRQSYLKVSQEANKQAGLAGADWAKFVKLEQAKPVNRRTDYDIWYEREWGLKVGTAKAAVAPAANAWANELSKAFGGYQSQADALVAFENDGLKVDGKDQTGRTMRLHPCSIGGTDDLANFIKSGDANATANSFAFFSELTTDKGHRTEDKWSVSARGGWGPFAVRGGTENVKIHEDQTKFNMVVTFRNLAPMGIDRPSWYRSDVVGLVNSSDRFQPNAIASPEKLWGDTGIWQWTPTTLILGYKPSLKITFSKDNYDYLFSKWNAGGGFSVGPFSIGGKGGGSSESKDWDDEKRTLSVEYKTNDIYVVGVINSYMPKSSIRKN